MMKLKTILPICFLLAMLTGCSSDDESTPPPPPEENQSNYFPLTTGNSWSYNNKQQINQQTPTQSQETMTVESSNEENGVTYFNLDTDNAVDGGIVTKILSNGELSKVDGKLLYDGSITFDLGQLGLTPVEIPLDGATIFDVSAESGTELFTFSDTVEQDIVLSGQTVHLTIDYTVSTTGMGTLPTFSAGGQEYEDVLQADLLVTASVTGSSGPISVEILANPEVVAASNYYADGVGLIFSEVETNYDFEENLPFQTVDDIQILSSQKIDTYNVADE